MGEVVDLKAKGWCWTDLRAVGVGEWWCLALAFCFVICLVFMCRDVFLAVVGGVVVYTANDCFFGSRGWRKQLLMTIVVLGLTVSPRWDCWHDWES